MYIDAWDEESGILVLHEMSPDQVTAYEQWRAHLASIMVGRVADSYRRTLRQLGLHPQTVEDLMYRAAQEIVEGGANMYLECEPPTR